MRKILSLFYCVPLLVFVFFISCSGDMKENSNSIPTIDLEKFAEKGDTLYLSNYAEKVSYISLETTPSCIIGQPMYILRGDKVFILDLGNEKIYLFDTNGKFIRQIGQKGKGPQEYIGGRDLHVSADGETIFLMSTPMQTIYTFSLSGELIGKTKIPYVSWKMAPLKNGNYFILTPFGFPHPDSSQFLFYTQDREGKVLFKDYGTPNVPLTGKFDLGNFYETPENTLVQHPFSDTVFSLNGSGQQLPSYILNFGRYKTPPELFNDKNAHRNAFMQYANWLNMVETKGQLFVSYYLGREMHSGIYFYPKKDESKTQVSVGQIINDLDGGPDFWPRRSDGNKFAYSLIQPTAVLEAYNNGEYNSKTYKDKKAREKFESLMNRISETDNPIIMLVELK